MGEVKNLVIRLHSMMESLLYHMEDIHKEVKECLDEINELKEAEAEVKGEKK